MTSVCHPCPSKSATPSTGGPNTEAGGTATADTPRTNQRNPFPTLVSDASRARPTPDGGTAWPWLSAYHRVTPLPARLPRLATASWTARAHEHKNPPATAEAFKKKDAGGPTALIDKLKNELKMEIKESECDAGTETIPNHGSRALIIGQTCRGSFSAVSKPTFCK